ncbi:MAG: TnpV protein, partial [Acutalibacteraceae bacterium]
QLGKWGMMHKDYLRKHKPVFFATLFAQGKLWRYLSDIDRHAKEMYTRLVNEITERDGLSEQMKEENQMDWVQRMNNIQNRATEIVMNDFIIM